MSTFSPMESQILRVLAIMALALALVVAAYITFNSGILDGGSSGFSGTEEALDAVGAAPAEAAEGQEAAGGQEEAPAGATAPEHSYVVQEGDSFYTISREFNTSISEIQQLNPNLDPSNLTPGTRVVVP